jgi:signal transduction histidine kinase
LDEESDTGSNAVRSVRVGLLIVKEIAKAHRGTMRDASSVRAGIESTLRFPAAAEPAPM